MKPVPSNHQDVKRFVQENCRAKLISQVVGSQGNHPTNEFASYFRGAMKETDPHCLLTSHGKQNIKPKKSTNFRAYPAVVQNIRWSPYVEMCSASNSKTNFTEDNQHFKCKCRSCPERKCPSRTDLSNTMRPNIFKDNIMTFADQCTMTPKLNDVCCGVCAPGLLTPTSSNVCTAVRDTETESFCPYTNLPQNPIPILKRSYTKCPQQHYCYGHPDGYVSCVRQEAVRDTDATAEEDYSNPVEQKSFKSFFKFKKKPSIDSAPIVSNSPRKMIYNEGISDDVTTYVPTVWEPLPVNKEREPREKVDNNEYNYDRNTIPYSHNGGSRYHHHCRKSDTNPPYFVSPEFDDARPLLVSPRIARKTLVARQPSPASKQMKIALPRKVLTSELDIDAFMERSRPTPPPPPACRRTKSKRFF